MKMMAFNIFREDSSDCRDTSNQLKYALNWTSIDFMALYSLLFSLRFYRIIRADALVCVKGFAVNRCRVGVKIELFLLEKSFFYKYGIADLWPKAKAILTIVTDHRHAFGNSYTFAKRFIIVVVGMKKREIFDLLVIIMVKMRNEISSPGICLYKPFYFKHSTSSTWTCDMWHVVRNIKNVYVFLIFRFWFHGS